MSEMCNQPSQAPNVAQIASERPSWQERLAATAMRDPFRVPYQEDGLLHAVARLLRARQSEVGHRRPFTLAVGTIAEVLGVSVSTARKRLDFLERHNLVRRVPDRTKVQPSQAPNGQWYTPRPPAKWLWLGWIDTRTPREAVAATGVSTPVDTWRNANAYEA